MALALAFSGLLACAGSSGAGDGAVTGKKFGAVIVWAPGLASSTGAYYASAAFSDVPRLLHAGEFTSLRLGIGEPDGCTKSSVGACQVFRCSKLIEATSGAGTEPNVGAITIAWPSPSAADGGNSLPPSITFGPDAYDTVYWGTATLVSRFTFSAAGATLPAFAPRDVDFPELFDVTQVAGSPLIVGSPAVSRAADVPVAWTGGTGDAVLALEQTDFATGRDVLGVCRAAASAGTFTIPAGVLGQFQPGDASLAASVVSKQTVASGDHATTLAIASPVVYGFPLTIE